MAWAFGTTLLAKPLSRRSNYCRHWSAGGLLYEWTGVIQYGWRPVDSCSPLQRSIINSQRSGRQICVHGLFSGFPKSGYSTGRFSCWSHEQNQPPSSWSARLDIGHQCIMDHMHEVIVPSSSSSSSSSSSATSNSRRPPSKANKKFQGAPSQHPTKRTGVYFLFTTVRTPHFPRYVSNTFSIPTGRRWFLVRYASSFIYIDALAQVRQVPRGWTTIRRKRNFGSPLLGALAYLHRTPSL